jgi:hypothetical protein
MSITLIETSADPKCQQGHAFDLHAHVLRGGDSDGNRIFTLNCRSINECKEWMSQICTANGTFELRMKGTNPTLGLRSFVNEAALKVREQNRRKSSMHFANTATIQKLQTTSDGYNSGAALQESTGQTGQDEDLTEEEQNKRKMAAMSQRHRPSILSQPTAGGGGGGGGLSSRRLSVQTADTTAAVGGMAISDNSSLPPPPATPTSPLTSPPAASEYNDNDVDDDGDGDNDVQAAFVSQGGSSVTAASQSRRGPLLAVGGRGRGAGRGAAFQSAGTSRRGSAIASGNM